MCDVTPVGRNDVMFAHYVVRRNITYTLPKASSLARKGKHRSVDLLYRRCTTAVLSKFADQA